LARSGHTRLPFDKNKAGYVLPASRRPETNDIKSLYAEELESQAGFRPNLRRVSLSLVCKNQPARHKVLLVPHT
jgi:hypothetical protein